MTAGDRVRAGGDAPPGPEHHGRVTFGEFELELASGLLTRSGALVDLAPRPSAVLCHLASRPGILVSRDDLYRAVWPDQSFGVELSLNSCMKQVRAALGDSAAESQFIRTVHRRGYVFVAPVTGAPGVGDGVRHRGRWVAVAVAALSVMAFLVLRAGPTATRLTPEQEAVLATAASASLSSDTLAVLGALDALAGLALAAPHSARVHEVTADLLSLLGRDSLAASAARRALDADGAAPTAHAVLGALADRRGDWGEAEEHFRRAGREGVRGVQDLLRLARHRSLVGDHAGALELANRAVLQLPVAPATWAELGWLRARAGDDPGAAEACGQAVRLDDVDWTARTCRLHAALRTGDSASAARDAGFLLVVLGHLDEVISAQGPGENLSTYWQVAAGDSTPGRGLERAAALLRLGDTVRARSLLGEFATADPQLEAELRHDPRFRGVPDLPLQSGPPRAP